MSKPLYRANHYDMRRNALLLIIGGTTKKKEKIMNKLNSGKEITIKVRLKKIKHEQDHEESEGERQAYSMFGV